MTGYQARLTETLESLPTLTEKLQTWHRLIKDLHEKEEKNIKECIIGIVELDKDQLSFVKDCLENDIISYKMLFDRLLSRLSIPLEVYKERILELEELEFKPKVEQFRKEQHSKNLDKVEKLAQSYLLEYNPNVGVYGMAGEGHKRDYMNKCKSMVTAFLFQTEFFKCSSDSERLVYHEVFSGWNPEIYVDMFCKRLNELFKDL